MSAERNGVSFVIPCLNEEGTLPIVLEKINRVRKEALSDRSTEIVVSDNGSTDASVRIAGEHGARVVHCERRGYGAALQAGIAAASHDVVIFADADDTYDFLESPALVRELEKGFDLVLGSRLDGKIHPGAMPWLHRRLGTPVLNRLINLLHARNGNRVADCNSGFRCFRAAAFRSWEVGGSGMEFASEMLLKALKSGARISHVPVTLYADHAGRTPHLRTWRDGMRHLLQILLEAPHFFHGAGLATWLLSWIVMLVATRSGIVKIGFAEVLGLHTMMFAMLGSCFGLTLWSTGLLLSVRAPAQRSYRLVLELGEGALFWGAVALALVGAGFFAAIVWRWSSSGFENLALERETLLLTAFGANALLLVFNVITAHLLKQMAER
jgi:glycosyltransferase involved in cell wall biosynthesis